MFFWFQAFPVIMSNALQTVMLIQVGALPISRVKQVINFKVQMLWHATLENTMVRYQHVKVMFQITSFVNHVSFCCSPWLSVYWSFSSLSFVKQMWTNAKAIRVAAIRNVWIQLVHSSVIAYLDLRFQLQLFVLVSLFIFKVKIYCSKNI